MDYASQVWSLYTVDAKDRLEALQRHFIRLVGLRLGYDYLKVSVDALSVQLNLPSIALRRDVADTMFLLKIINGHQ